MLKHNKIQIMSLSFERRYPLERLLYEPTKINNMTLKNRLVRSATYEAMAAADGSVTDQLIDMYTSLAKGGVGLIITGTTHIQENGHGFPLQTGVFSDDNIPGLRKLVDAVHKEGGKIALQIAHAGRQTTPALIGGQTPMAPSAIEADPLFHTEPREMTTGEISETIDAFAAAAARCKKAGFDAVQLHGAHGYLIAQFLSPFTNRRTDEWGGNTENRMRFVKEVIKKVRAAVGPDYPILIKISVEEGVEKGLKLDESCIIAKGLADAGVDAIEVSGGIVADTAFVMCRGEIPIDQLAGGLEGDAKKQTEQALYSIVDSVKMEEAYWLPHAEKIKGKVGAVPVMLVGGMKYPQTMETIVEEKKADFISLARALVREPALPKEMAEGRKSSVKCAYCNRCLAAIVAGQPLKCYNRL
jgi:2,4-dienoyl-CoA reductase-like NADH-dependent reductase (Old Yellow Enzyme family)